MMYQYQNPYSQMQMPQTNPYRQMFDVGNQSLVRVTGIDGARAYQMNANSQVALFDSNNDIMYIKCTDGAGFPTIRTFRFEEIKADAPIQTNDYVSREEMEEYVKQFIQSQQSASTSKSKASNKSTADADS